MKEHLLLIMPYFMDYETALEKALRKRYDVTMINGDQCIPQMRDALYANKLRRLIRKIFPRVKLYDQEKVAERFADVQQRGICLDKDYYSVVLCVNAHGYTNRFYNTLKERNPNGRFILYLWDDAANLFKKSHIGIFCEKYSYNIHDCQRFGMKYLPMFVQSRYNGSTDYKPYDIAVIASVHSDRVQFVRELYRRYRSQYRFYIYFFDPKGVTDFFSNREPLPYGQYIDILSKSKAVLDIPNTIQEGPTTRFTDALMTKTKVITTNNKLVDYPFFSSNDCVIDKDDPIIAESFISSPFREAEDHALTVEEWLTQISL